MGDEQESQGAFVIIQKGSWDPVAVRRVSLTLGEGEALLAALRGDAAGLGLLADGITLRWEAEVNPPTRLRLASEVERVREQTSPSPVYGDRGCWWPIVERIVHFVDELRQMARSGGEQNRPRTAIFEVKKATEAAGLPGDGLTPAVRKAGASLEWVRKERPDLSAGDSNRTPARKEYNHIKEHGCEAYPGDENGHSSLPRYETWARYCRRYQEQDSGAVNSPRAARNIGSSIARSSEI